MNLESPTMSCRTHIAVACLLIAAFIAAPALRAEEATQWQIKGKLSLSDGRSVGFDLLEGAKLSIWDRGEAYALVATVIDAQNTVVRFAVFDQATDEKRQLGVMEVTGGQLKAISGMSATFGIEVSEVRRTNFTELPKAKATCGQKAQSTKRLIVGQVELATGGIVTFKTSEGKTVRVTEAESGRSWELTPSVVDQEELRVRLELVEIPAAGIAAPRQLAPLVVEHALSLPAAEGDILVTVTDIRDPQTITGEAMTVPTSSRRVHARLTIGGDRVVNFTVREGELFTISDSLIGYNYGLAPDILNEADLDVQFRLYELTEYGPLLEGLKLIGHAGGSQLQKTLPFPDGDLRVEVLEITPAITVVYKEGRGIRQKAKANKCCVTCDGTETCGCAVSASCGTCCVDPCCVDP